MRPLIAGYRRFRENYYPRNRDLFAELGNGQAPRAMVIACCDSRADPAFIFDSHPGELFVVRNVANLVPPYEQNGLYHGTSSAIEFAVRALNIETILVLGHSSCGGVAAALRGPADSEPTDFIGQWISLLDPAKARVKRSDEPSPARALELESVAISCENLMTFPFVRDAVAAGRLELAGAHFEIPSGRLRVLDGATGRFDDVAADDLPAASGQRGG